MFKIFKNFFSRDLFISIRILIRLSLKIHYIHINLIKYSFDDLKKIQFAGKISRETSKILFQNDIWNPHHPRQIQTINRSQKSFVNPINRNTINRNNLFKIDFNTISDPKKL